MNKYERKLKTIINKKYGVCSGVYSVIDSKIKMTLDNRGEYIPVFLGDETEELYKKLLRVDMMSDESPNEDKVSKELFSSIKNIKYNNNIGYYLDLYAGHVLEDDFRLNGSSGGFVSWILVELFKNKKIDGVIHVHKVEANKNGGVLFKYQISKTIDEIKTNAKSRYYPVELSEVLCTVKKKPGRYAVVGIPEFIMELRLLAKEDADIKKCIKYMIGLVCGHQKTTKYTEALAWQHGIEPGNLMDIDFRVKQSNSTAMDYLHRFTGKIGDKKVTFTKTHAELFVDNWALGFFKSKFSDFTDNTFNETADIVLGDAWLPRYNDDGMGNNIIIVRNQEILNIIKRGIKNKTIKIDNVNVDIIKNSQLGLIHHTRDELPYRLSFAKRFNSWVPQKRSRPSSKLSFLRKRIQNIRYKTAINSHKIYTDAVKKNQWQYFEKRMDTFINRYAFYYKIISWREEGWTKLIRSKLKVRTRIIGIFRNIKHKTRIRTRLKYLLNKTRYWFIWQRYKNAEGAILTLAGCYNYGNMVQRYALQEFLRQNNHKFISYIGVDTTFSMKGTKQDRFKYTASFVKNHIWCKSFNPEDNYKTYIVGSDQVWRNWVYPNGKDDFGYFFFNFAQDAKTKRIAYAASFGQNSLKDAMVNKELEQYISSLIKNINYISMREKSGISILKKTWNIDSTLVLDPTMLLDAKDYNLLIEKSKESLKRVKPIYAYMLSMNKSKQTIIDNISKSSRLESDGVYPYELDVLPPVEQWLKGFKDSDFIVTDSFHGAVFSIIYNKEFVVIENSNGGISRLKSLLGELGLGSRIIFEKNAENFDYNKLRQIEWEEINRKVEAFRKKSSRWLIESIEGPVLLKNKENMKQRYNIHNRRSYYGAKESIYSESEGSSNN
jgi:coenzyme F420-reducing hydrogenase beta subunit